MRVPLAQSLKTRDGILNDKDALMLNCFPAIEGNFSAIYKRPGTENYFSFSVPAPGQGIFAWKTEVYAVAGNVLERTVSGFSTTLTGTSTALISWANTAPFADNPYVFIKKFDRGWLFNPDTDTLTPITQLSTFGKSTVPGVVNLDGYFFVMTTDGRIFNSGLTNPVTGYTEFISITSSGVPVAIAKHENYLVAFTNTGIEFFYDAGNATGSPLAAVQSAPIGIGCFAPYSIADIDGGLAFVSSTSSGQISVHMLPVGGTIPIEIADENIQRILKLADLSDVRAWGARAGGHLFYVIVIKETGIALAYDATSKSWAIWTQSNLDTPVSVSSLTQANGTATFTTAGDPFTDGEIVQIAGATPAGYNGHFNVKRIASGQYTYLIDSSLSSPATGVITAAGVTSSYFSGSRSTSKAGVVYVQDDTTGDLSILASTNLTDVGNPIDCRIRSGRLDGGTLDWKVMSDLMVVADKPSVPGGTLKTRGCVIRWSDDDYDTFSPFRHVDLMLKRPIIRRMSRFARRAFDIRYGGDGEFKIYSIDVDIGAAVQPQEG